ncbi:transposase (IS4 family) [Streptococcus pneumoniae]|nr:transposase (IS4 family) [Streptococcus pneumoniae]
MAYSIDFRKKVLSYCERIGSITEASHVFQISRNTIYGWLKLKEKTGELNHQVKGTKPRKVDRDRLKNYLTDNPDAYLPETTLAFVDLGYLGILKFHENTFIPAKNSKNRRLSEDDKQLNKEMSAIRIEIEHFNAKFKTFQIMSVPYRNRRKRFELRAELICAIINYEVN